MTISIVMTTYNGEKYVVEQLNSLLHQNRKADEVIVLDDCSTDSTVQIVENFIQTNHLENWRIQVNPQNVGWMQNFFNGFEIASCDLVFPCDQDDIWHSDKLGIMAEVMEKNPQVDLLVGDADYIFEENKSNKAEKNDGAFAWITNFSKALEKKKFLQNKKYTKAIKQQKFDASYRHVRQGCLMCFRKSFWNEIKEFWYPEIAHDCFLSFYAKLKGTYYALDYPVITYRFHSNNSSMPERGNRMVRLSGLEEERLEIESLIKNINCVAAGDFEKKQLQNAKRWNQNRISLVEKRNFWAGVKLLKYLGFYKHKKHFISDCFFAVRGK